MAKKIIDVYYDDKKGIYKEKFENKFRNFVIWVNDNKELIVICAPIIMTTCKFGSKLICAKQKRLRIFIVIMKVSTFLYKKHYLVHLQ